MREETFMILTPEFLGFQRSESNGQIQFVLLSLSIG